MIDLPAKYLSGIKYSPDGIYGILTRTI